MNRFPLEAHQQSLQLALDARRAFARGREAATTDPELADEHYLEAFDLAREVGLLCRVHDLPAPFALRHFKPLLVAFADGEDEGTDALDDGQEIEIEIELNESRERLAA